MSLDITDNKEKKLFKIGVVDDDTSFLIYCDGILEVIKETHNCIINIFNTPEEVVEYMKNNEKLNFLITDHHMPNITGLELCKIINDTHEVFASVIMTASSGITSNTSNNPLKHYQASEVGASFLNKLDNDFGRNLIGLIKMEIRKYIDIEEKIKKEQELALIDPLTGLGNRLLLDECISHAIKVYKRDKVIFSMVVIDIDHFKNVNDTYGHQAGDDILKQISSLLKDSLRESDKVFRFGGEEFVLYLPGTDVKGALKTIEELLKMVSSNSFSIKNGGEHINITISAGITDTEKIEIADLSHPTMFEQGDRALYVSKTNGRNQATIHSIDLMD